MESNLEDTLRHFQEVRSIIYPQIKRKIKIAQGKISEEDKIEIIKLGFQLNQEGKISLKKYYEGTGESSLFQLKGYSIKTKLYQSLKE